MDIEGKFDVLLKTIAENEKKRMAAEDRTREDLMELKAMVEGRLPQVEKRVEDLNSALGKLNSKVEHLEKQLPRAMNTNEEVAAASAGFRTPASAQGTHESPPDSAAPFSFDSSAQHSTFSAMSTGVCGSVPPMTCPQFNGDNPQMWRANCEVYFDIYGVLPQNWVKVATLNFCGNAAFWLQSVRNQLIGITWSDLCEKVCARFSRDRQQALIRQWIHLKQGGSVGEYVERFDCVMHQLLAYEQAIPPIYFVTKFMEGLRDDIRSMVLMQRPQDLDTACSLALLQEETAAESKPNSFKRSDSGTYLKSPPRSATSPTSPNSYRSSPSQSPEDKRNIESPRVREDRISALKAYRRSKGLCFTCGERWSRDHKCATTIQLHVVEELLEAIQADPEIISNQSSVPEGDEDTLMSISSQALHGSESSKSIKLRGWVQNRELLVLVDSGSTHSFIDEQKGQHMRGLQALQSPLKVQVADGGQIPCSRIIPQCSWWTQGHSFKTDFRLLPLGSYDVILGMDWLEQHSPMQINWSHKWLEFQYNQQLTRLQGLIPQLDQCDTISVHQLQGMAKTDSIECMVQLIQTAEQETSEVPAEVQPLLQEFQDLFTEPTGLPPKRTCDHHIPLIPGAKPVNLRPYRYKPALKNEIERQVAEMLKSGVIQPSQSPFSSPALLVKKKDGSWRLCIDYRQLDAVTVKSKYPVPIIEELLDELAGSKWFSKLDLRAGYHQIRMAEGEEFKTAFQTHSGHYEFKVMSFGLTGAPATFLGAMNTTLATVLRKFVLVFFDDILIYSPTITAHLEHLRQVLQLLSEHNWKVKLSKCSFAQQEISYLGHIIGSEGVSTDPKKIQDVVNWAVPNTVKKLRGFLGLAGYYRKFVKGFGEISKSLTQLLRKGVPFQWTQDTDNAFQHLKKALVSAPVLALPDFTKQFTLETDASEFGIGAVLSQDNHPIAFLSRALGPKSKGLSTYEKEYMAILLAVDHWRPYLQHAEFLILTDHHSLKHLSEQRLHTPWQQKAYTKLLGLQYKICYRKGIYNSTADALSRKEDTVKAELVAISEGVPLWMQDVIQSYETDSNSTQLLAELSINPNARPHFTLKQGILMYKGRIWVGQNGDLQSKIIDALHSAPIGGH